MTKLEVLKEIKKLHEEYPVLSVVTESNLVIEGEVDKT